MNIQPMQGRAVDGRTREPRELTELKEAMAKNMYVDPRGRGYGETPSDHMSVGNIVNLLANDMRQLVEEIGELRARLSPVLADQNSPPLGSPPNAAVLCKMAAEMSDVLSTLQQARQLVSLTLSQLDI